MLPDVAFAQDLISRHGSPLYVYDLNAVAERARALKAELPDDAQVYYSFKANPLPALARELRLNGCRAEITSEGELASALEAGFPAAEMMFGGPGKTAKELNEMIHAGIRFFSCESFPDVQKVSTAAKSAGVDVNILLRVNPPDAPDARMAMTGIESQFGLDEEQWIEQAVIIQAGWPRVTVRGIHVYFGTQVATREALVENTLRALQSAERLEAATGLQFQIVNAGGGFPWPYASDGEAPDFTGLKQGIEEARKAVSLGNRVVLWFESGRHLVAGSGTLLTTVVEVKRSRAKHFVILDTGIHHLGGMTGLGRIPRFAVTFKNLTPEPGDADAPPFVADLVGPLCSPLDSLARSAKLPNMRAGNLLAVPNVGAYGLTASLIGFLSHPAPMEVAFRGDQVVETWQWKTGHAKQ
ncbi:MAG: Decarboxylase [Verrucomicrobiaceae bacterium]|nr:Decarboxylase [Verrucomicrobiaceae bacterium]